MERSTCFNVTFDSDDCSDIFTDNKISNFRVRLPRNIHLNETWRVGLADVTFSNSRFTFDRPQRIDVYSESGDLSFEVFVGPALYDTIADLVQEINLQIQLAVVVTKNPEVIYKDGLVTIKDGNFKSLSGDQPIKLKFSPTLHNILGLSRWGMPFINARQSIVFVYCSILKQRVVGDSAAKLLRTVDPSKGKSFGSVVSQVFRSIYYCPIDNYDFSEIEIQLLDDTGKEPVFKFGSFRVTLQFKQFFNKHGSIHNAS